MRGWLAGYGLEELTEVFVSKDYTDVELMKKIGVDDDDLDFLEINDATQRAILQGKQQPKKDNAAKKSSKSAEPAPAPAQTESSKPKPSAYRGQAKDHPFPKPR